MQCAQWPFNGNILAMNIFNPLFQRDNSSERLDLSTAVL